MDIRLISGTSNRALSEKIAQYLGINLTDANITNFNDGEAFVEINENIRGEDVFVIQPTSTPVNDNIIELLVTIDALKRGSAGRITAVIPYFGYARQDRKTGPRTPISAKLIANLITVSGANRVLTLDLHATQIQGFFDIPVDNIYANKTIVQHIEKTIPKDTPISVTSPDIGGVLRARAVSKWLKDSKLSIIEKKRIKPGVSETHNIIGEVKDNVCILIDDIADTAGTLCNAANMLTANGAKKVIAYVTHGVFSPPAIENIEKSSISEFYVTNTINNAEKLKHSTKIHTIDVSDVMAESIKRIHTGSSVSHLFLK